MDKETAEKVRMLDFRMGQIRGDINSLEKGHCAFAITEGFQNVLERDLLEAIRNQANAIIIAILKSKLAELEFELEKL